MALRADKTEGILDKASNLLQTGFSVINKMVFLNEDQQDTINAAATNFEIYNKMITSNTKNIEESVSKMTNVEEVKLFREAMERIQKQEMQDTARKIAAGEDVGIRQMKQFSDDLITVRKGIQEVKAEVSISFDDLTKTYSQQIVSNANSDKAQEMHFRSLLIAINQQSNYLENQIKQMEKQGEIDEEQTNLLEAHRRDLEKIKQFSEDTVVFSKMGPEELKKNKEVLNGIMGRLSDQTFESKMVTTMNKVDNSIQSLSVDSENLNNTMEYLGEAQSKGKEVVAGTARDIKKGAKGAVSSMILSSLGLGGLDEALGISEKFSELDLFGKEGLFGKKGLLSNIVGMVKGGGAGMAPGLGGGIPGVGFLTGGAGISGLMGTNVSALGGLGAGGMLGAGLGVVGAAGAGYAAGTGINKLIDKFGGEKNFLGASAARAIYGGIEKEAMSTADTIKKWQAMSGTFEGIDQALTEIDEFIKIKEQGQISKAEEQSINAVRRMAEALKRKKERLEKKDKNQKKIKSELEEEKIIEITDTEIRNALPEVEASIEIKNIPETGYEETELQKLTNKKQSSKIDTMRANWGVNRGETKLEITNSDVKFVEGKPVGGERGIIPNEIQYLPKTIEDTTTMIIRNAKEENARLIAAQKVQSPAKVPVPAPTVPAPVDLNKTIDDPTLTIFNNDIFG